MVDKVLSNIFVDFKMQQQYTTLDMKDPSHCNSILCVTKPFGTFIPEFLGDVLNRILSRGYKVKEYKVFETSEMQKQNLVKLQYKYLFEIAHHGKRFFTLKDYEKMKDIYLKSYPEYNLFKLYPAYSLHKFGLSKKDIVDLWIRGYNQSYYLANDHRGINKIGMYKYILLSSDTRIYNGEPFFIINGLAIHLEETMYTSDEKAVAFLIIGDSTHCSSWKEMRESFLGDKAYPLRCPLGSIRYDAYSGKMKLTKKVEHWNNVFHMSSGPLESLYEEMLWLETPLEKTIIGKVLMENNFTMKEIEYFITNPFINIDGIRTTMFHMTEKMNLNEVISFLKNLYAFK